MATHTIYRACNHTADTVMYHISGRGRRTEIQASDFIGSLVIDFNKPNILSCISWLHIQSTRPGAWCLTGRPSVSLPISMRLTCKSDETIAWMVILDLNGKFAEVPWKLHTPQTPPNSSWMLMNINECNSACHVRGHLVPSTYSILWTKYCIYFVNCVTCVFKTQINSWTWKVCPQADFSRHFASLTGNKAGEAARAWMGSLWILRKPQEYVNTMQFWQNCNSEAHTCFYRIL